MIGRNSILITPILAVLLMLVAALSTAEECKAIRFEAGHYSGTVKGVAPPDDTLCYSLTTGSGQRAELTIVGKNMIFSIDGVVDAQDAYSFTTKQKTYKVYVGQLMRSVTDEPFSLRITVK